MQCPGIDVSRGFSQGKRLFVRTITDGFEWSYVDTRSRRIACGSCRTLVIATSLRSSELLGAALGNTKTDEHVDHRLSSSARVASQVKSG